MQELKFDVVEETIPGEKLNRLFLNHWPAFRAWYLDEGEAARPTYLECVLAFKKYMPELYPLYQRMQDALNCDDLQARFLSLYQPPPFYSGCSQLIFKKDRQALIRNYDFPPILCEGTIMYSRWLEKGVIAMADCGWGVLDGMNDSGLSASIAFGGRFIKGDGFGISIVIRYILETCSTVEEAIDVFQRIPVHLDYNIALIDKAHNHATLFVAPSLDVFVSRAAASTNHHNFQESDSTLYLKDSKIRLDAISSLLDSGAQCTSNIVESFLRPPIYRPHYVYQSGTLYTAAYYPQEGEVTYLWQDRVLHLSFNHFTEQEVHIIYDSTDQTFMLPM